LRKKDLFFDRPTSRAKVLPEGETETLRRQQRHVRGGAAVTTTRKSGKKNKNRQGENKRSKGMDASKVVGGQGGRSCHRRGTNRGVSSANPSGGKRGGSTSGPGSKTSFGGEGKTVGGAWGGWTPRRPRQNGRRGNPQNKILKGNQTKGTISRQGSGKSRYHLGKGKGTSISFSRE